MISGGISYIFSEPVRRSVGIGGFLCRKFHLSQKNSLVFSVEHIQFNKKSVFFRNHIAVLGNEDTVCFRLQMLIGFSGERKILFFTAHETLGFVSKKIVIILPADADDRGSAKIPLLDPVAGIRSQILRKVILPDQKFTFDLHIKNLRICEMKRYYVQSTGKKQDLQWHIC